MQDEQQNDRAEVNADNISQSRLASLVGFEEEASQELERQLPLNLDAVNEQESSNLNAASNSEQEPLQQLSPDPKDAPSTRPAWMRPENKAYVVMGGTSVVALLFYLISSNLLNSPLRQAQKPTEQLQNFPTPEETRPPIGAFKVETALGDQATAISRLNEKNKTPTSSKVARPINQKIAVVKRSSPRPVTSSVTNLPPRRFVRESPTFSRANYPQYRRATPPAPISSAIAKQSQPQVQATTTDPMEQWLAASQIGSHSSLSNNKQSSQVIEDEQVASEELSSQKGQFEYASLTSTNSSGRNEAPQVNPTDPQAEQPILQEKLKQFLKVGTTAKAMLATSLAWDDSEKSLEQDSVIVILKEPLVAADGVVVVPEGSQLVAKVQSVFDSGLVRLVAVAAIVDLKGEQVELDIPTTAIQIRGLEGKPLIANQSKSNRSGSFGADISRALLGAARNGASVLNRPRQSTSFSSGGYSTSSQSNDPDFLAGVLEGASDSFLDNLERRNHRRSESSPNSSIWLLKAKTQVEVFVSESVSLDLLNADSSQVVVSPEAHQQEQINSPQLEPEFSDRTDSSNLYLEPTKSSSPTNYYLEPQTPPILPNSY